MRRRVISVSKHKVLVDAAVLVFYLLAANPAVTGIPLHEWIGPGAVVVLVAHCASSVELLPSLLRPGAKRAGRAGRAVLDAALLVAVALCAVSGIMVSGDVLPALGLYAEGYYFWDPLHAFAAKALLALILVHLAIHARMVWVAVRSWYAVRQDKFPKEERYDSIG